MNYLKQIKCYVNTNTEIKLHEEIHIVIFMYHNKSCGIWIDTELNELTRYKELLSQSHRLLTQNNDYAVPLYHTGIYIVVRPVFGNIINKINILLVACYISKTDANFIVDKRLTLYEDLKRKVRIKKMINITRLIITLKTNQYIKRI